MRSATKFLFSFFLSVFGLNFLFAQQLPLVTALDNSLNETSGLIYVNNTLITHNDSGGANELYEVDVTTGSILRTVTISNASNVDWEDITSDDTYIYIGDIGNNSGSRTDLKVYRILISDFFNFTSVTADVIDFSYKDQSDFTPNPGPFFTTDYDAEALISYQGNLYIFTKQWTSQNTSVYGLPNTPGSYELNMIDSITINGLVTGSTTSEDNSTVLLTGYSNNLIPAPFITELQGFSGGLFSNGTVLKTNITPPSGFSIQTEAIAAYSPSEFYVSSESFPALSAGLYNYTSSSLNIESQQLNLKWFYPNPSKEWIYFKNRVSEVQVFNLAGQLLLQQNNSTRLNISNLHAGVYLLAMTDSTSGISTVEQLFVY